MRMSKISLTDEAGGRGGVDAISAIYSRVRDDATAKRQATYTWAELTSLAGQDFTVRSRMFQHLHTLQAINRNWTCSSRHSGCTGFALTAAATQPLPRCRLSHALRLVRDPLSSSNVEST